MIKWIKEYIFLLRCYFQEKKLNKSIEILRKKTSPIYIILDKGKND